MTKEQSDKLAKELIAKGYSISEVIKKVEEEKKKTQSFDINNLFMNFK